MPTQGSGMADPVGERNPFVGRREATSGAWASAADHLSTAARLTSERAEREQLTLETVECRLLAGDAGAPGALAAHLRTFAATGWRSYILARLALVNGLLDECEALLRDGWQRVDPEADPVLGARIAGHFALVYGNRMRGNEQADWADRALRLAPNQTATDMIRFLRLCGSAIDAHAEPTLATLSDLPEPAVASAAELEELLGRGVLRHRFDDVDGALQDLTGVLTANHNRSAMFRWVAAGFLAMTEFQAGRWDDAAVHSDLALSVAADADQIHLATFGREVALLVPAARGDWPAAEVHLRVLEAAAASGHTQTVVSAAFAQAQLARARGLPEAVVATFDRLFHPRYRHALEIAGSSWWIAPLFDALIAIGQLDRAETELGWYEALAAERGQASALAVAGQTRGALAAARGDDAMAEQAFDGALAHAGQVNLPFNRALLQLAYGKVLRRTGRRARAGEQLRAARDVFTRLGARRAVDWLLARQEPDGSWYGRWGANRVYGIGAAVPALVAAGVAPGHPAVRGAVRWLERHQRADGGWGEDARSYVDPDWVGRGEPTASQTAWALLALLAADAASPAVEPGIRWLVATQRPDGTWDEPQFTGTGFPQDLVMIRYGLYRQLFPLAALGRFLSSRGGRTCA